MNMWLEWQKLTDLLVVGHLVLIKLWNPTQKPSILMESKLELVTWAFIFAYLGWNCWQGGLCYDVRVNAKFMFLVWWILDYYYMNVIFWYLGFSLLLLFCETRLQLSTLSKRILMKNTNILQNSKNDSEKLYLHNDWGCKVALLDQPILWVSRLDKSSRAWALWLNEFKLFFFFVLCLFVK